MAKQKKAKVDEDQVQSDSDFPKKWEKLLSKEWKEMSESFSTEDIKKKIVQFEQAISATEKDEANDLALNALKERKSELTKEIKELSEVYSESVVQTQAQIRWLVHLLDSRGTPVEQ